MIAALFLLLAVQDPGPVLDRASKSYDTVRTLAADFIQVIDNPMLGDPDTTRGRLFLRKPNQFSMRFTEPPRDRIVADGRVLWLYTPSTTPGQVIRTQIPGAGMGPNLIGEFVERPRERYYPKYLGSDSTTDAILLSPRATDLPYSAATVWISKQDGLVRKIEIVEPNQRRTIILRQPTVNGSIPAREFRFVPPAGSQVVDQ